MKRTLGNMLAGAGVVLILIGIAATLNSWSSMTIELAGGGSAFDASYLIGYAVTMFLHGLILLVVGLKMARRQAVRSPSRD